MISDPNPEPRYRWLLWPGCAAFLIGVAMGVRVIRTESAPLPIPSSIPRFAQDDLKLDHPLFGDPLPANLRGNLRIWLYDGRELAGPPLAVAVQPPAFDVNSQWLTTLIKEKITHIPRARSITMRGWITFSSPHTMLHLRSENGYRVRFRNALGAECSLVHWEDDVTEDFACGAVVEPGRYEIEIVYFSAGGDGFFEIWGTPEVQFDPAPDPRVAPR
jgi:hypothetical protein